MTRSIINFSFKKEPFRLLIPVLSLIFLFGLLNNVSAGVNVWEDSLTIPTYLVDPPNPMPRFYEGRTHQGVQRRVYPYPMNDGLTRTREDRSYPIVYLENEYIKIGVMPGMGGRIFSAVDKTNDYKFFYLQHVIKPSLIGMLGYWISGSNAWGFPHHHGPNTVKPMEYRISGNPDGSKTIWIANTDRRHRMRVLIGYTVFPNSSIVEMTIRPTNRTPVVNSFLFWANPSVHVDTTYQVIFPPSVKYVTQHAKREMTTWPVADRRYNNFDYRGVNISLWKNIGVPSSFFSWNPREDYFGGYDHGKNAGTVWIGNHYITPGMKFWAWGNNPGGDRANEGLTDNDGHYIELMAGAYTDNQPDYSWLQPFEGKSARMVWFPIRELGGLKYANENGALNMDLSDNNTAVFSLNTTSPHNSAQVILRAGDRLLYDKVIDIDPGKPFTANVALQSGLTEENLSLELISNDGEILLAWDAAKNKPVDEPMPEPLKAPQPPEEIKTVEELYLTGLRLNQFYNASLDPMPYYQEALKHDPGDYRVNTQLGILAIKAKKWKEAEQRLRTAVDRITSNYTRPKDGEALYYLGVVLKAEGKYKEAYDYLYRATWSAAWHTPAYYELAEIDCRRGDYARALNHLDRSISTQTNNLKALNLKTAVLRKSGYPDLALQLADQTARMDALDFFSRNESGMLRSENGETQQAKAVREDLNRIMRDDVQSYLELATDYGNCGFYDEAIDVLSRLADKGNTFPMLYYYLGFYSAQKGDTAKAKEYCLIASQQPHTYCFPFRAESIDVLNFASDINPGDARAPYYLGNLLYESQPENAIAGWEKSRALDDSFYIVHRNLGLAYEEVENNIPKSLASYEKAVACNSKDPRLLFEIDQLYEKNKVTPEKRYALFKNNHETARLRTESLLREATCAMQTGNYDEALEILLNNSFPQFEGGREMQDAFLNSFVMRGLEHFRAGRYNEALRDYRTALAYPVGRWGRSRWAQFYYLAGAAYDAMGRAGEAKENFEKALAVDIADRDNEYVYYHGMALKKLKREDDAGKVFAEQLSRAQQETGSEFFRQFEAGLSRDSRIAANHYQAGLAYEGMGRKKQAGEEFSKALELDPGQVWSKIHLQFLDE